MGGNVPLGYEAVDRTLRIIPKEAETVRTLFDLYEQLGTVTAVTREARGLGLRSKLRQGRDGRPKGGSIMSRGQVHHVLSNPVYAGRIRHKEQMHDGQHAAIIEPDRWKAIQTRLMDKSAKPRRKPAAAHPSPLAGKLFVEKAEIDLDQIIRTRKNRGRVRLVARARSLVDGFEIAGENAGFLNAHRRAAGAAIGAEEIRTREAGEPLAFRLGCEHQIRKSAQPPMLRPRQGPGGEIAWLAHRQRLEVGGVEQIRARLRLAQPAQGRCHPTPGHAHQF